MLSCFDRCHLTRTSFNETVVNAVCQLLDLCLLVPDIQEELLGLEVVEPRAERALGAVAHAAWVEQRPAWAA